VASAVESAPTLVSAGWLRSRSFDLRFIVAVAGIALFSGLVTAANRQLFELVLLLDLWLLGYHHVVATGTRLCFDRRSLREHRFLVFGLPPLMGIGILAAIEGLGPWSITTTYLYWQWFHYTRQSYGIAQVYRRKSGGLVSEHENLSRLVFYLVPLWGILHRSAQDPGFFLGVELRVLPVTPLVVDVVGAAALAGLGWWALGRVRAWREGRLPVAHTLYVASHHLIFAVGYILIPDIDCGWLTLNVWHNAQYLLFVWMFNTNRFKDGVDPDARFLSTISQEQRTLVYTSVCLGISTAIYFAVGHIAAVLPVALVTYQVINFHHYIVDGVIWKVRKKNLQKILQIEA
jgi:hypothetical protein